MNAGKGWSSWLLLVALASGTLPAGCAIKRGDVEKNLMADKNSAQPLGEREEYVAACPDVLELNVALRPEFNGKQKIGPDGRVELGDYGKLRVEGRTLTEVANAVARATGERPENVAVRVVEFRSQHVLLFGQVNGMQRTVPYRGQETVLELLQRTGGITPGAEPNDVYVVRAHLGDNQRPEVFQVDLEAIVMKSDPKTNVRVQPFDQVYVGETRQSRIEKIFPPWLRPVYQAFWKTQPNPNPRPETPPPSAWVRGRTEIQMGNLETIGAVEDEKR
jgi:polysaccharide export outer membrane protein